MERSEEALSDSAGLVFPSSIITANSSANSRGPPQWPTIDGPLGLSEEDSIEYARRFFKVGFLFLPWLWALNCFYFWPVLRHSPSFPHIRPSPITKDDIAVMLHYGDIVVMLHYGYAPAVRRPVVMEMGESDFSAVSSARSCIESIDHLLLSILL
ncbi:hypothetical protein RJ640_008706 [Escallonia rubra]|uniref:Gamma-secretase subunit PEN-2 n=1 Tax=Escallonia rubra TaxID=112253 RepID=A0AA88RBR4_9ASTE|nr:hypothetical protein RJ640_008706 [Escallonia rubra]